MSAHLVGQISEESWGQTYHSDNLFFVVEINGHVFASLSSIGKTLLDTLITRSKDTVFNSQTEFAQSIDQVVGLVVSATNQNTSQHIDVAVIAARVKGNRISIVTRGDSIVFLARGGQIARISHGINSVSGVIMPNDTLYLFSPALANVVSLHHLRIPTNTPLETIAEEIAPLLHTLQSGSAAGIITRVNTDESNIPQRHEYQAKRLQYVSKVVMRVGRGIKSKIIHLPPLPKKKRLILALFCALLIVFSLSMVREVQKKDQDAKFKQFTQTAESINHNLEEAEAVADLNGARARTLVAEAKEKVAPFANVFAKNSPYEHDVAALNQRIRTIEVKVAKVYAISNPSIFYDLTLIKPQAKAYDVALYQDNLGILDQQTNVVYLLRLSTKRADIVAGGERLKHPQRVASSGDTVYVLSSEGVVRIDNGSKKSSIAIPADTSWGAIADIATFGGNLYLLDAASNQIYKYSALDEGFGPKTFYVPDDSSHHFNSASSLAIDGSVWVLTGNHLVKFLQGRPEGIFGMTGLDKPVSNDTQLYTDDENQFLYILDRGNSRVVTLDKQGIYQAQYVWDGIKKAAGFVVSEKEKKILIFIDNMVYKIDI